LKSLEYWQRLRDLREDRDFKQEDIAKILEIDTSYYGKYERGLHEMKIWQIIKLCLVYNVCSDYVLGLTNEPKPLFTKEVST